MIWLLCLKCAPCVFLDISWERRNSALCTVKDFLPRSYSRQAEEQPQFKHRYLFNYLTYLLSSAGVNVFVNCDNWIDKNSLDVCLTYVKSVVRLYEFFSIRLFCQFHVVDYVLCLFVLKRVSEAFVVCQNYSPPEGYTPNMFNPLLNNHSGTLLSYKLFSHVIQTGYQKQNLYCNNNNNYRES